MNLTDEELSILLAWYEALKEFAATELYDRELARKLRFELKNREKANHDNKNPK